MNVWVHVWRGVTKTLRGVVTVALLASASGCIDDFDDPKGYGANGGRSGRLDCSDMCERIASCDEQNVESCQRDCVELEGIIDDSGCSDEFQDAIDCFAALDDLCLEQSACDPEVERFTTCMSDSCGDGFEACAP